MKRFCIQQGISIFLTLTFFLIVCSCEEKPKQDERDGKSGISRVFQKGPIKISLFVSKKTITIAERLKLSIEVVSDESYAIELPEFGKKLGKFDIIDYKTGQLELIGKNQKKIRCSYVLEPFLAGEYSIPSIQVQYRKKDEARSGSGEIETEELKIQVTSLLKTEDPKLHEIKPPVDLPGSYVFWIWIAAAAVVVSSVIIICIFRYRKRAGGHTVDEPLPAHVIAFGELDELYQDNLPEKGQIKIFYQRISDILRRYIENRFGLRAPEQTTEEFLTGLDSETKLDRKFKPLLRQFLNQCDLVKFAEHMPTVEDINKTFENCRSFIDMTKENRIEPSPQQ